MREFTSNNIDGRRYPDENLEQQAKEFSLLLVERYENPTHASWSMDQELFELVFDAFRSMRDALEEPGKYDVEAPVSPKVLV